MIIDSHLVLALSYCYRISAYYTDDQWWLP